MLSFAMSILVSGPGVAALLGALCVLPFVVANAIVANRIEPFFSFIRAGPHTSAVEVLVLAIVVARLPLGAFVAARPLLARSASVGSDS